jgi:hypothetical protein
MVLKQGHGVTEQKRNRNGGNENLAVRMRVNKGQIISIEMIHTVRDHAGLNRMNGDRRWMVAGNYV